MSTDWQGDNPFCLVIRPDVGQPVLIDLDRPGWLTDHADLMRAPGRWILARKAGSVPVLMLHVVEGEQPYYTARIYGAFLPPVGAAGLTEIDLSALKERAQIKVYGIGKKLRDGTVNRMWVLPTGSVVSGDDDGPLADELAKAQLAALLQERINGPDDGRDGRGPGEEAHSEPAGQVGQAGREDGDQEGQREGAARVSRRDAHRAGRRRRQADT